MTRCDVIVAFTHHNMVRMVSRKVHSGAYSPSAVICRPVTKQHGVQCSCTQLHIALLQLDLQMQHHKQMVLYSQ